MKAHGLTPILNVSDLSASLDWFARLGWRTLWTHGDPPSFAAVGAGHCQIFLCLDGQGGRGDAGAWLAIFVDDADEAHRVCLAEGLDVTRPPTDEPWGIREMHVRHPDGHVLRIGHGLDHHHDHDHDHDHEHPHDHSHDHSHDH